MTPGAPPPPASPGEDLFRVAVLHSSDLVSVHDRAGAVLLASPSFTRTLALPPDGGSRATLLELVHPDDVAPATVTLDDAMSASEPLALEVRLRGGDGSFRWYELRAAPWRGEDGTVRGLVVHARDVHLRQRVRQQQVLAERGEGAMSGEEPEALLRAIFENALEALLTVGDDGAVLEANTAATRLLALPRERIVGRPWNLVFGQDADPAVFLRQLRRRRHLAGETQLRVGDGSVHDVEYAAVADVVPGVHFAALRDLTEQHRMQAQLALADRMASVGTLAAGVAHELNNPLAYVAANLAYVGEQLAAVPPELRGDMPDAVREAREGAERMRAIVRDLRTFSRGDDRPRGPVAIAPVLESCIQLAWNELRHRARVVRELAPVPPVRGSEARLGQVFLNLLVNAAHAIPEGDAGRNEIRVTLREAAAGRVAVEIRDTGSGIATHDLPRIFDPFYTTKAPGVGTGLGLSICHNIVSAAGGTIEVETAPGHGSTFRVLLPVSLDGLERAAEPAAPGPPPVRRTRVLVVDDEPFVASAVRRALGADHHVAIVPGGREALAALDRGERFDLVLSDLLMPEMTGMELHREIAARDPALAGRMVFLTGGAFTSGAREFIEAHRADCVEKPFDVDALRELVRRRARTR